MSQTTQTISATSDPHQVADMDQEALAERIRNSPSRRAQLEQFASSIAEVGISATLDPNHPTAQIETTGEPPFQMTVTSREFDQSGLDLDRLELDYLMQYALAAHETGHARYTDGEALKDAFQTRLQNGNLPFPQAAQQFHNLCEDGYLEWKLRDDFGNRMTVFLDALNHVLLGSESESDIPMGIDTAADFNQEDEDDVKESMGDKESGLTFIGAVRQAVSDLILWDTGNLAKLRDESDDDLTFANDEVKDAFQDFFPTIEQRVQEIQNNHNHSQRQRDILDFWQEIVEHGQDRDQMPDGSQGNQGQPQQGQSGQQGSGNQGQSQQGQNGQSQGGNGSGQSGQTIVMPGGHMDDTDTSNLGSAIDSSGQDGPDDDRDQQPDGQAGSSGQSGEEADDAGDDSDDRDADGGDGATEPGDSADSKGNGGQAGDSEEADDGASDGAAATENGQSQNEEQGQSAENGSSGEEAAEQESEGSGSSGPDAGEIGESDADGDSSDGDSKSGSSVDDGQTGLDMFSGPGKNARDEDTGESDGTGDGSEQSDASDADDGEDTDGQAEGTSPDSNDSGQGEDQPGGEHGSTPQNSEPLSQSEVEQLLEQMAGQDVNGQVQEMQQNIQDMLEEQQELQEALESNGGNAGQSSGGNGAGGGDLDNIDFKLTLDTTTEDPDYERAGQEASSLAAILEEQLRQSRQTGTRRNTYSGTLDESQMHGVATGRSNIMQQDRPGDEKDYSVSLVLDRSGSMSGNTISVATKAVMRTALALEQVGIDVQVMDLYRNNVRVVSPYHQPVRNAAPSIYETETGGGTPLTDALKVARERANRESRHPFVIVITDGRPGDESAYQSELEQTNMPVIGVLLPRAGSPGELRTDMRQQYQNYHSAEFVFNENNLFHRLRELMRSIIV